ncbi:MAG: hypothetical protein ISS70_08255 [Phycisphaerae bacterium]|nr:hypothetical protein [Phycisphaerae bacterium]
MAAKRKRAKKRPAKKSRQAPKKSTRGKKLPAAQREYKVGNKKPPEEHQFKAGESGNPKGASVRRTNLWVWLCKYMALDDRRLAKLDRTKLTQAQQTALKLVENAKNGKYSGSERLARYMIDREEGKAVEHLIVENENTLTDEECEDIREVLLQNAVE